MARIGDTARTSLKSILEGVLMASDEPLTLANLAAVFTDDERPSTTDIHSALQELEADYAERGIELKEVASGWRIQVREDVNLWVTRLWEERPQRYSRALLETLALIAYRQPITRGDIEEVRGVSVRSSIIRTLQEREWIRVVGHRDVPGKPALFGTTRAFLDYFNLASLDDLPSLAEIRDMAELEPELDLETHVDEDVPQDSTDEAGEARQDDVEAAGEAPGDDAPDDDAPDDDAPDDDAPDDDAPDDDAPDDDAPDDDAPDDDAPATEDEPDPRP
jgi:segregation and condensation protein B